MIAFEEKHIRVPEDISVIGFDKIEIFGGIYPNLTLITQPQRVIGECAANQMLSLLRTPKEKRIHQVTILSTIINERSSVRFLAK